MYIVCSDLEGVFIPEIWINVAKMTGIKELNLTTRDISDYDVLMKKRISILNENNLKIEDIKKIIDTISPLEGALDFLNWLRSSFPVLIASDTFVQFAGPIMKKLGWPTLLCNSLIIDKNGTIKDYKLRQKDGKKKIIISLKSLNYKTIAVGDSYNDVAMLKEADTGILFRPPVNVRNELPELTVSNNYDELKFIVQKNIKEININDYT